MVKTNFKSITDRILHVHSLHGPQYASYPRPGRLLRVNVKRTCLLKSELRAQKLHWIWPLFKVRRQSYISISLMCTGSITHPLGGRVLICRVIIFTSSQRRERQTTSPPALIKFLPQQLVTHLDEPSTLKTIFTHYPGCGWHDVICTTGSEEAYWEFNLPIWKEKKQQLTCRVAAARFKCTALFLLAFHCCCLHPHPSNTVTINGNHPSISFSCTLGDFCTYPQTDWQR